MITAWRLCRKSQASEAFLGLGAAQFPGRWNHAGLPAVYLAENRSLAALEVLVHAEDRTLLAAASWVIFPVRFDPALIHAPKRFPGDCRAIPIRDSTRQFGSRWLETGAKPVLRVPSAVILGEFNYLLNPQHAAFTQIQIGESKPFRFDARLR